MKADSTFDGNHVDCVAIGEFDCDESNGFEVAMAASDRGFLLVDAQTGEVRKGHRIGHAQCLSIGNYRPDLPGSEIWVGTRWGSPGILTLFSGKGEKLFSFNPDCIGQGGVPVNWTGDGRELLLLSSSRDAFGLYDAQGQKVVTFPEIDDTSYYMKPVLAVDLMGDPRDEVVFVDADTIYIYTQNMPFKGEEKIYAPIREKRLGHPVVSLPSWKPIH